jgi:phosphatidylglycerophosphatase C
MQGDRVVIATGAPPELARAILDFVAHEDLPVIGSLFHPFLGGLITAEHCHAQNKMRMLWDAGYDQIAVAYSDSSADLPLLQAAKHPVVVNPKPRRVAMFRRVLPPDTPIHNWGCPGRAGNSRGEAASP